MRKTLSILLLLFSAVAAFSQKPCTDEDASQELGGWSKQKKDDLAEADRSFPKEQYPVVLLKAQKVIELLKQANPS